MKKPNEMNYFLRYLFRITHFIFLKKQFKAISYQDLYLASSSAASPSSASCLCHHWEICRSKSQDMASDHPFGDPAFSAAKPVDPSESWWVFGRFFGGKNLKIP